MRSAIELPYVHDITLVFEHGRFVVVHIKIVWRTKNCHNGGESGDFRLAIHPIPSILCFMRANNRQQTVAFEELACSIVSYLKSFVLLGARNSRSREEV